MNQEESVVLTETGQRAVIGHMMSNSAFFVKCKSYLPPEAFIDSRHRDLVGKLYSYHEELGRTFTFSEFELNLKRDEVQKAKETYDYRLLYSECAAAAREVRLDVVAAEMKFWVKTLTVRDALNRATSMFNRGDVEQAAEVIESTKNRANGFTLSDPASDLQERREQRRKEKQAWIRAMRSRTPFINECLDPIVSLTPGLIAVGAPSGTGKSTCVANLLASFYLKDSRIAFLLSGEETVDNSLGNISCCLMKLDYIAYRNDPGKCPGAKQIEDKNTELEERILVRNKDLSDIQVTKAEVNRAIEAGAGLIVVDYLQFVTRDSKDQRVSEFEVSRRLAAFLADVAEKSNIPIVLMLQLANSNKKLPFSDRTFGNRSAFRHFTEAIELTADKVHRLTWFRSWKSRQKVFAEYDIPMQWDMGRLEPMSSADVKRFIEMKKLQEDS